MRAPRAIASTVVLLAAIAAAAQRAPVAAVRIEAPSPAHDAALTYAVVVAVDASSVRELVITINGVSSRAAVRDGRAMVPMHWIAGNNRVAVEARVGGRVVRDSVTVFRRRAETMGFTTTVSGVDGDPREPELRVVLDCDEDRLRPDVGITPGVHRVCLVQDVRDVDAGYYGGPIVRTGDAWGDGRPVRIGRRVRVEVRVFGGMEREQRWIFNASMLTTEVQREVGTFEVTPAMLAPGSAP